MKATSSVPFRLIAALAVGLGLVVWLYQPGGPKGVPKPGEALPSPDSSAQATPNLPAPQIELTPSADEIGRMLHAPTGSGDEDNDIVNSLFYDFRKLLQQGNPVGMNEDITAALLGDNPRGLAFLSPDHPAIRDGQLIDRWGTPFWFHSASANVMEIRSAGPDKKLFTGDDIVLNDTGVEATLYGDADPEE